MRSVAKVGVSIARAQHASPWKPRTVRADRSRIPSLQLVATAARTIRIGVLGCGNVAAALAQLVARQTESIEARTGVRLEITRVAVRNMSREAMSSSPMASSPATHTAWSSTPT